MMRIVHRDEVEAPFTDWLQEAYEYADGAARPAAKAAMKRARPKPKTKSKPRLKTKPLPKRGNRTR
jgi:hypothetical protein